jgi:hypothetical protein
LSEQRHTDDSKSLAVFGSGDGWMLEQRNKGDEKMSEWLNQFENHQVHNDIRSAITPAEEIKSSSEGLPADVLERIDRVVYVLSELKRRLRNTDPLLIPVQPLNNLHNPLTQIASQLANFQNNHNAGHIQNAHNQLENVLVHLAQIPAAITIDDMDSIKEAAVGLRRSAGQHIRHLDDEHRNALQQVDELKQSVESLASILKQRSEQANTLLDTLRKEFDESEASRQKQFSSKEEERINISDDLLSEKQKEWDEIVKNKQSEYEGLYETIKNKLNNLETEFKNDTKAILDEMAERKNEAERVVGAITDTGMVGGYQRVANSEKRSALFWRTVAFLSLCLLVGFAVVLFKVTLSKDFEVTASLTFTRVFVALAVAVLAGYAARQADKHERVQRHHRKMELELASIAPYLHEFPDDEVRKIKTDLAMRMFAQQEVEGVKESKKTTNSVLNLLEMALDSIKSLTGKG